MSHGLNGGSLPIVSSFGESSPTTIARTRWHPKATPFRLLTTLSVAGLGLLKAILTYNGSQLAPVTVEWICGTLLFLLFYFLDISEQDGHLRDDVYHPFYDYDCMDLVWKFLTRLNINRPEYSTSEASCMNSSSLKPLVTNYRLLVSATVLTLGMLKAILTYRGLSNGAVTVDWIFGVVVMTGLYVLGLYESNDIELLPVLFDQNDSQPIGRFGYECGLFLSIILLICTFALGLQFSKDQILFVANETHEPLDFSTADGISTFCAGILMLIGLAFVGYISFIPLILAIFMIQRYFEPSATLRRLTSAMVLRYRLDWIMPSVLTAFARQDIAERGVFILRSINHLVLHVVACVVVSLMGIVFVALSIQLFAGGVLGGLYLLFLSLGIGACIVRVVMSLFRPFFRMQQTGVWRGEAQSLGFFF